jgi:hypothetical protein
MWEPLGGFQVFHIFTNTYYFPFKKFIAVLVGVILLLTLNVILYPTLEVHSIAQYTHEVLYTSVLTDNQIMKEALFDFCASTSSFCIFPLFVFSGASSLFFILGD